MKKCVNSFSASHLISSVHTKAALKNGFASSKLLLIFGTIIAVLLCVFIIIAVFANKNTKAMNAAIEGAVSTLSNKYTVTEIPCGEYEALKVNGFMKFHVKQYNVETLGNLCFMTVNVGVMQMTSMVLNIKEKNLPLVSADYMYLLGKRKCYLEFYDFVENQDGNYKDLLSQLDSIKQSFNKLEDVQPTAAWYDELKTVGIYKSGSTSDDETFKEMMTKSLKVIVDNAQKLTELSEQERLTKKDITKQYTENLITKGGVSTDVFKKSLGETVTRDFFGKVFFGTDI